MHIDVALALIALIPAVIALVQEDKDNTTKTLGGIVILMMGVMAARRYVEPIGDLFDERLWLQVLTVPAAVIGWVLVVRLKNQVLGTLICTGTSLLALQALTVLK